MTFPSDHPPASRPSAGHDSGARGELTDCSAVEALSPIELERLLGMYLLEAFEDLG